MNQYSSYKESGVEWIGEIPNGWSMSLFKYELDYISTGGTPSTSNDEYWGNEDDIPWVSISDMTSNPNGIVSTKKHITEKGLESKGLSILSVGTLIYSIYDWEGK